MTHPLYQLTHPVDQFLWDTYSVSSVPHPFHSLYCISSIFPVNFSFIWLSEPLDKPHTQTPGEQHVFLNNLCCTPSFANMGYSHWSFPNTLLSGMFPFNLLSSTSSACGSSVLPILVLSPEEQFVHFVLQTSVSCSPNLTCDSGSSSENYLFNEYEARVPRRLCQRPKSLFTRHHPMLSCLLQLLAKTSGFSWLQVKDNFQIPGSPPSDSVQHYKKKIHYHSLQSQLESTAWEQEAIVA